MSSFNDILSQFMIIFNSWMVCYVCSKSKFLDSLIEILTLFYAIRTRIQDFYYASITCQILEMHIIVVFYCIFVYTL